MIYLSDGLPFEVRRLGLFELDKFVPTTLPPITYTMEILGKSHEIPFNMDDWPEPPVKPSVADPKPNTPAWFELINWQLYQAGLVRDDAQAVLLNEFYEAIVQHILKQCDDTNRIVDEADWQKVYEAALTPQLTMDILADTLERTYAAEFGGKSLFDALATAKKGHASYNVIRLWENKLMLEMQMQEAEYILMPLDERARKVCALFLDDIMQYLETDHASKTEKTGQKS